MGMWGHDRIWRCDCGDQHFLAIKAFDPDEPDGYLALEGGFGAPRLRDRWRVAWRLLRTGRCDDTIAVVLSPAVAGEVRDELDRLARPANPPDPDANPQAP